MRSLPAGGHALGRSPHPESNRNPLSTKQVLYLVSFEGIFEAATADFVWE